MGWVWVLFFKALIVDGGEGLRYFFHFFYFHVRDFLGSFALEGSGGCVGCGAFF
jgi:hypothetical protein